MLVLLLALWSAPGDEVSAMIADERYLDAALAWREQAYDLASPEAVRWYVVLLSEYHTHQIAFRTFFMKNLGAGERLDLLRSSSNTIEGDHLGQLVEDNLEALLVRGEKAFPDDLDIKFARALFTFRGHCCLINPQVKPSPKDILATFRVAKTKGIISAGSLWVMALAALDQGNPPPEETSQLIARAHELAPQDLDIYLAYVDDLIAQHDFNNALAHARTVLDSALTPAHKTDALAAIARLMVARNNCPDAMIAVRKGLEINPLHGFLWVIGLDCLRKGDDVAAYVQHIQIYLDQDPANPGLFQSYLDYLRLKGVTAQDEDFLAGYERVAQAGPLPRITQLVNIASYHLFREQKPKARIFLEQAQELAAKLEHPPPDMDHILSSLMARAGGS